MKNQKIEIYKTALQERFANAGQFEFHQAFGANVLTVPRESVRDVLRHLKEKNYCNFLMNITCVD
jgi:hypothetical protein